MRKVYPTLYAISKKNITDCDSKGIVSPITAKVKCPHQGGIANDGRHSDE